MGSLDQESLFSLELVADNISLSKNVSCRFPAIAFRLLDFPTLIIYHIEPDLGEAIKRKIKADPLFKLPDQLSELKDKNGLFQVRKGKSCLFKVPPTVLLAHLQNTPMYVMLIDTYPTTPKLVGNCTVPMDMTMNNVFNDVKRVGLSVPTSHGEKGTYKIFNLMGVEIGEVTFGFRLLSLGVGLISHLPDKSVVKMKTTDGIVKKSASVTQAAQKPMEQEATEMILQDLETVDQNIQVVLSTPRPKQNMMDTQTEINIQKVAATQTEMQKKKKVKKEQKQINRIDNLETLAQVTTPCDDIIITNTVCPPPMFYNIGADPPEIAPGLTFDDYLAHKRADAMKIDSDTESVDSDSTIRLEDRFSDSEMEIKPTVKTVYEPTPIVKKAPKKKITKPVVDLGAMADFPLLSALMSEIVSLQGVQGAQGKAHPGMTGYTKITPPRGATPRTTPSSPRKTQRPVSPTRTVMLRQALSAAIRAKPIKEASQPSSPRRPQSAKQAQTKNKGWLNKELTMQKMPPTKLTTANSMEVKKTKIMPGMTNTQRLRLAKTNPQLLARLEKEETDRVEKFKAKRKELGEGFSINAADISTEVSKHPGNTSHYDVYARKSSSGTFKRPIPTPRSSLIDDQIVVREIPSITPRVSRQNSKMNGIVNEEHHLPKESSNQTSARSNIIDVHMPSARLDETVSDDDASDVVSPNRNLGRTYTYNPGFPNDVTVHSIQSNENIYQYSDDFEDAGDQIKVREMVDGFVGSRTTDHEIELRSKRDGVTTGIDPADELGLKLMVDKYSDDEHDDEHSGINQAEASSHRDTVDRYSDDDADTHTGIDAGEGLNLRQIVDKYSDDDNSSEKESQTFHSAASDDSEAMQYKPKLKIATSLVHTVAPSTSDMSPIVATKQPNMPLRNGVTASSSTLDDTHPDSTAYIHRSEMSGSQFSSIESTGPAAHEFRSARKARRPLASPRKSLERIHTESVSSYAPSDMEYGDIGNSPVEPLSPTAEYSDNFESAEESDHQVNIKYMKDAKVAPEARFGYTWSGGQ